MIEFKIPKFADTDWESAIKEADRFDKILLPYLSRAIDVVKNIEEKANPQSLAWMIVWTHVFTTLQGAQAAAQTKSELSLNLLNRSCMELELILFAISSPIRSSSSNSNRAIRERLTAYAAWCLWKDISAQDRMLERRNVDAIWDDSTRNEIAEAPDELEMFEKIFGKIKFEDPKELEKKRRAYEKQIWESQSQLKEIANHPEIEPWVDKLETNAIQAKQKKEKWINSYFDLIGESETSIMQRLIKMNIAHGYSLYEEQSLLQHASTFNKLIYVQDDKAYPRIDVPPKIIENLIQDIGTTCNSNIVQLAVLKKYI